MSGFMQVMLATYGAPGVINGSLPNGGVSDPADATWQLSNDGSYSISGASAGNWVDPASSTVAAYYQVKVDATSGAFSSGGTGSWLDLSTSRAWTKTSVGSVTFTVTIREKASGTVRSTQTGVTLTVV